MAGEQLAGLDDAVFDGIGELALSEMVGHGMGDLLPEVIAAAGVDGLVAQDGELLTQRGHEDQHAMAQGRSCAWPAYGNGGWRPPTGSSTGFRVTKTRIPRRR